MQKQRRAEAKWIEKENRWCIQVQSQGTRRRFYSTTVGKRGKVEAERKADEWLSLGSTVGNAKAETVWKSYLDYMKAERMDTHQYESIGRVHILPVIGRKRVDSVTEFDLQTIVTNAFNKDLSKKTLENIRGCISAFMRYCRTRNLTTLHPENIKINKKARRPKKKTMQPDDLKVLFSECDTVFRGKVCFDWYIYAYRFQASTGLRPSELFGIYRSDVDMKNKCLTISRAYTGRGHFSEGKSENASRTIVLNNFAIDAYYHQVEMLDSNGLTRSKCKYLFPKEDGSIGEEYLYWKRFSKYCEAHGFVHYTPYELRHTYISVNRYMPDSLLKLQVGHSQKMDTRGVYGHEIDGDSMRAAEISGSAFAEILGNKNDTKVIPEQFTK